MKDSINKFIIKITRRLSKAGQPVSWQAQKKNAKYKVALVEPVAAQLGCGSVLDIGCNAGETTRLLGKGMFAVGVDIKIDVRGFDEPFAGACLGEIEVTQETLRSMPQFDAVCLFSVHHQWYHDGGKEHCEDLTRAVAGKAKKVLFVEFAATNKKYQKAGPALFVDNDEDSIKAYATDWLKQLLPSHEIRYLGKTYEMTGEPYRYMFACQMQ
ncbi:MAG: class I SAM-dependent methyltransferase [bacterium]|nr:class I SAM-dependent methyltransferase [bacterium]